MGSTEDWLDSLEDVGYGKPPRHSQFKKGRSGNPKGRPKGSKNVSTMLRNALREKVTANENGRQIKITKGEAMIKQLVNKAAAGDHRSIALVWGKFPNLDRELFEPEKKKRGLSPEAVTEMRKILIDQVLNPSRTTS